VLGINSQSRRGGGIRVPTRSGGTGEFPTRHDWMMGARRMIRSPTGRSHIWRNAHTDRDTLA
jgi:hypothetical protein